MDDEQSFKQINDLSTKAWVDSHIILERRFVDEARKYKIKPLTNMFWVYQQHRQYEEFGKFGWCVAGAKQIAEDCGLTERQVVDAYVKLMEKGAIKHIWCDSKVYRNKTRLYVSSELISKKVMQVSQNNIMEGKARKLPDGKTPIQLEKVVDQNQQVVDQNQQVVDQNQQVVDQNQSKQLNKQLNKPIKKERKKEQSYDDIFNEKQVDGKLKDAFVEFIKSRKLNGNKMTDRALELAIDKVRRLSNSETTQVMIINQSIEMGWKGVFPLKEENKVNSLEKVDPAYCSDECAEMFNYWGKIIGMRPQQNLSNIEAMETMLKENGADQVQKMIIALRMRSEHGYLTKEIRDVSTPADLLNNREIIWGFYTKNENTWREWAENARQGKKKWEL